MDINTRPGAAVVGSREVGQELAGRFPNVRVCDSNQDVLDSATSIVLAVRPPIARAVLAELSFRPRHVVLSVMAGMPLERLLATLTDRHMTPGGTNQQLMTDLRRDGVPDLVRRALDRILTRLREQAFSD